MPVTLDLGIAVRINSLVEVFSPWPRRQQLTCTEVVPGASKRYRQPVFGKGVASEGYIVATEVLEKEASNTRIGNRHLEPALVRTAALDRNRDTVARFDTVSGRGRQRISGCLAFIWQPDHARKSRGVGGLTQLGRAVVP